MEDQEILKTRIFRSNTILSLPHPQQSPASSICPTSIQGGYIQSMQDQQILMTRILKSISPFPSHLISLSSLYPRRAYSDYGGSGISQDPNSQNHLFFLPSHLISLSSLYPMRTCHQIMDDQKILKTRISKVIPLYLSFPFTNQHQPYLAAQPL